MKHAWIALFALIALTMAFVAGASGQFGTVGQFGDPIKWRTYLEGDNCKITRAGLHLIQSEADWQTFWTKLSGQPASTAPRDIDWLKENLIAVTAGSRPTAGFSIYIETVDRTRASEYVLRGVEVTPMKGQVLAEMLTAPYVIIRIEKLAGNPQLSTRTMGRWAYAPPVNKCGCHCGCGSCKCR